MSDTPRKRGLPAPTLRDGEPACNHDRTKLAGDCRYCAVRAVAYYRALGSAPPAPPTPEPYGWMIVWQNPQATPTFTRDRAKATNMGDEPNVKRVVTLYVGTQSEPSEEADLEALRALVKAAERAERFLGGTAADVSKRIADAWQDSFDQLHRALPAATEALARLSALTSKS